MPYLGDISAAIPQLCECLGLAPMLNRKLKSCFVLAGSGAASLDGEWLFKASLVVMSSKLVVAAGPATTQIMSLIVPLIEESMSSPAKEHFEEDGLVL